MPKIKPLSKRIGFENQIVHNLEMIQGRKSDEEMSAIIGTSRNTYRNRKILPRSLTVMELYDLCTKEHVSMAEFVSSELKLRGE